MVTIADALQSEPNMILQIIESSINSIIIVTFLPESFVEFTESVQYFDEDQGEVHIAVYRQGSDLTHVTKVLCSSANTDPPNALPAVDYEATDVELTFLPGQHLQVNLF